MPSRADAKEFLDLVQPLLTDGSASDLARAVLYRWTPRELCPLLSDESVDVRRVAAMALGLVGDRTSVACMTRALQDPDEQVNAMAEHGLWSIWFRAGHASAARPFNEGIELLADDRYADAIEQFQAAVQLDPEFSEAYNQMAIAYFFLGDWDEALAASRRALTHMPTHFGAMAGMGHCYAHLGKLKQALRCYRHALQINPKMDGIRSAIARLEACRQEQAKGSSGQFETPSFAR